MPPLPARNHDRHHGSARLHHRFERGGFKRLHPVSQSGAAFGKQGDGKPGPQTVGEVPHHGGDLRALGAVDENSGAQLGQRSDHRPGSNIAFGYEERIETRRDDEYIGRADMVGNDQRPPGSRLRRTLPVNADVQHRTAQPAPQIHDAGDHVITGCPKRQQENHRHQAHQPRPQLNESQSGQLVNPTKKTHRVVCRQ